MYKVINRFKEVQHNGHVYEPGDAYPVEGHKLVKARAESLTKVHAEYGVAFLQEIEEKKTATSTKNAQKLAENAEKSDA